MRKFNAVNTRLFVLLMLCTNLMVAQSPQKKILKIEYYSLSMTLKSKRALGAEDVKSNSSAFHATYYGGALIYQVVDNIPKLKLNSKQSGNLREICEIYYENGESEVIGLTSNKFIVYQGKVYNKNRRIYKNIRKLYPAKRSWLERLMY